MSYNGHVVIDADSHIREYWDFDRTYKENMDPEYREKYDQFSLAVKSHQPRPGAVGIGEILWPRLPGHPMGVYDAFAVKRPAGDELMSPARGGEGAQRRHDGQRRRDRQLVQLGPGGPPAGHGQGRNRRQRDVRKPIGRLLHAGRRRLRERAPTGVPPLHERLLRGLQRPAVLDRQLQPARHPRVGRAAAPLDRGRALRGHVHPAGVPGREHARPPVAASALRRVAGVGHAHLGARGLEPPAAHALGERAQRRLPRVGRDSTPWRP